MMKESDYSKAVQRSIELLNLYSPRKPPRFAAAPSPDLLDPERRIRDALAEAQFILNRTAENVNQIRIEHLARAQQRQRAVNLLHFVAASGFVLLIGDMFSGIVKWFGALASLIAGILAITIPGNLEEVRRATLTDSNQLAAVSGQVAALQSDLYLTRVDCDEGLAKRVSEAIGTCIELSKKYELDKLARFTGGVFPREPLDSPSGDPLR